MSQGKSPIDHERTQVCTRSLLIVDGVDDLMLQQLPSLLDLDHPLVRCELDLSYGYL